MRQFSDDAKAMAARVGGNQDLGQAQGRGLLHLCDIVNLLDSFILFDLFFVFFYLLHLLVFGNLFGFV